MRKWSPVFVVLISASRPELAISAWARLIHELTGSVVQARLVSLLQTKVHSFVVPKRGLQRPGKQVAGY